MIWVAFCIALPTILSVVVLWTSGKTTGGGGRRRDDFFFPREREREMTVKDA